MGASTMEYPDMIHDRIIHRVLKQKVEQYGNRDFFHFKDQSFGYEDFDRESDKIAAGLQALGIGKGDKVAIEMSNRPEFLFLWFGLSKLGAVEVPVNTAHRGNLLTYMIDKADCRLVVTESRFLDRLGPVLKDLPKVEKIAVLCDGDDELPTLDKPTLDYAWIVDNDGTYEEIEIIWSDPYAIMFTSGTTGPSKG
ncbi:MAG: AMP-binding protein, partial [Desulfobacteraceae bacterium]|nr:AMP-binding protein [Desulfobacteraceae bacterium]